MAETTKYRLNVGNIAFLMGTLLIALIGTPWYILTRGLGWPEALTCGALWLVVGISVTGSPATSNRDVPCSSASTRSRACRCSAT